MKKKLYTLIILFVALFMLESNVNAKENGTSTVATFTCSYIGSNFIIPLANPTNEVIVIDFKAVGDTYFMKDCNKYQIGINEPGKSIATSCSSYIFYAAGNHKTDLTCPSSINVDHDKRIITWVADYKGDYKHTAGTRTNYKEGGGRALCWSYHTEESCTTDPNFACVWNKKKGICTTDNLLYVNCLNSHDIPTMVPQIFSFIFNLLKIGAPIILVIVSVITLLKSLASSKDDEIIKAKNSLIKKLVASALIFFIASIVQFVILQVADNTESGAFIDCLSCFLNNECSEEYFKTTVQGTEYCTYLADTRQHYLCEAVYRSFKKTKKSKICGDVNQDYFVNNKDITMLWKYIDGEIELTEQQKTNANVNKDSFIDQYDANIIFYYTSNMVMGLDCASPSSNEEGQTDAKEWILGN